MLRKKLTIRNKAGLHMRAANVFADTASRFSAHIHVSRGELRVNGKSIMGLMMLAATPGCELLVEAEGSDAEEALRSLTELVDSGFGEELDPKIHPAP